MSILRHNYLLSRRTLLRGVGATLALPWLEAMSPSAKSVCNAGSIAPREIPKRAIFTFWGMGLNGRDYTPKEVGPDYALTPILQPLAAHRRDFTVISGMKLNHSGGHFGDASYLTGTNNIREPVGKFRVSCDQELAAVLGKTTRYPVLTLGIRRGTGFGEGQVNTLSWSESGNPLPSESRPDVLFNQLFRPESAAEIGEREQSYDRRQGVLDAVLDDAKRLNARLGKDDQTRLDEFFTSVRDVEQRMADEKKWLHADKPKVAPLDFSNGKSIEPSGKAEFDYRRYQRLMFDIIALALQTDCTRVISYMARKDAQDGTGSWKSMGNPYGYHDMTHHGEDADKLRWLTKSDTLYMEEWAYFLTRLKSIQEGDATLLDHALVAYGSSGGTLNAHHQHHLPALLCGGARLGVKHQGHLVKEGVMLGNLWQTMFDRLGVPVPENFQGGEADGILSELT